MRVGLDDSKDLSAFNPKVISTFHFDHLLFLNTIEWLIIIFKANVCTCFFMETHL